MCYAIILRKIWEGHQVDVSFVTSASILSRSYSPDFNKLMAYMEASYNSELPMTN